MREILFRGKRPGNGEWVCGNYIISPTFPDIHMIEDREPTISDSGTRCFKGCPRVDPATVGQYTGLKDCTGRKIFEGDIMKTAVTGITHHIGVVEFSDGAFGLRCTDGDGFFLCFVAGSYVIIGNIHDNPELLKGGGADA